MAKRLLVIHDLEGYIIDVKAGVPVPREPVGIPFVWVDVPEGKQTKGVGEIGVDVSVTPNQVILEDILPSETEVLKQRVIATDELILSLIESMYL